MAFVLIGFWMNLSISYSQMKVHFMLSLESNSPTHKKICLFFSIIHVKSLSLNYRLAEMRVLKVAVDLLHYSLGLRLNLKKKKNREGIKSINFAILNPPTLPVRLLYYRRKSTSFSTEGNLFGNHMALDVISGESSLMNTSNEVRLTERNIIFLASRGRYKVHTCEKVSECILCFIMK